jgi:hypothetical protein
MIARSLLRSFAVAGLLLSAQAASAQGPTNVGQDLGQSQFANGGQAMANEVQTLLGDKANLAAILAFARTANEDQRKAIALGLFQTAKAADPGWATQIQNAVALIPELAKAYADASGDTGTASTGGGGGGGGGGPTAGGPPTGGPNGGNGPNGSTFTTTQNSGIISSGLGGGGFSSVSQH